MSIEIKVLRAGDEAVLTNVRPDVFDQAVDPRATREFLADPRHHIAVAIEDGVVVGFASGVHYVHPDKPRPELWVNEIAVAPTHRGRGLGKALLNALLQVGRELGCAEAWVLTERTNVAAMGLYGSSGGSEGSYDPVMFTFRFGE
ncbi:MAG TPA: GNAT family N-acetyltransferase [Isosphaeraceae bacterium]|nr:GNAT family N-acetyltransferase [Isosphaeraceae bacterium]